MVICYNNTVGSTKLANFNSVFLNDVKEDANGYTIFPGAGGKKKLQERRIAMKRLKEVKKQKKLQGQQKLPFTKFEKHWDRPFGDKNTSIGNTFHTAVAMMHNTIAGNDKRLNRLLNHV